MPFQENLRIYICKCTLEVSGDYINCSFINIAVLMKCSIKHAMSNIRAGEITAIQILPVHSGMKLFQLACI